MQGYLETYKQYLIVEKQSSSNTILSYMRDLNQFALFIDEVGIEKIEKINKTTLVSYILNLERKGKSTATITRNVVVIRGFFRYLMKINIILSDPSAQIDAPKVEKKPPEVLTINEVEILLDQPNITECIGARDSAMLEIMYATGIRVSELLNLCKNDINTENNYITTKSRGKERIIPIGKKAVEAINNYCLFRDLMIKNNDIDIFFVNCNGQIMTRQGFWKIVKGYTKKAGIEASITPHLLRHSFAFHLISNGADINSVKEMMGHSDIYTTEMYKNCRVPVNIKEVYAKTHPRF